MSADDLELGVAWQRHVGRSAVATRWFESVVARHRAAHRYYHGVGHIRWVIRHATELAAPTGDIGAIVAAGFFHDAVYAVGADTTAGANEHASADLASQALTEIGWPHERIAHVTSMIHTTIDHRVPGPDIDHDVLIAADLGVLAADPTRYGDYVRNVRREYAHLDDDSWRRGRAGVLRSFLDRDRLFSPRLDLDDWELRARANLTAELAGLTS